MINNKFFIFTSAGDNTNFDKLWIGDNMTYDIYVIYYGDNSGNYNNYKDKVKYIEKRKGSKFQNFHFFYHNYKEIIDKYERFFILDDDIIFTVNDINKMFDISEKYNLSICGPSFTHNSKIGHPISKNKKRFFLAYTNFIEVNTPLFSKAALDKFMPYLDPCLIGWGIDYLYIWANGLNEKRAYAIIHSVYCENPKDDKKNNIRELTILKNFKSRSATWASYSKKIGCPRHYHLTVYLWLDKDINT